MSLLERAKARHDARTPQDVQDIKQRWHDRQKARAEARYNAYPQDTWERSYFDHKTAGYVVTHRQHQFGKQGGGGEAEKIVTRLLAQRGKQIELLPEGTIDGVKCPDVRFDGKTWDIKNVTTTNQRTIRKAYADAQKKSRQSDILRQRRYKTRGYKRSYYSRAWAISQAK